jgi:PAS domain S-box-containing protein
MKDTIWLMDMNLKTTYISPSVEKLRGYALEELQQLPLNQQLTPASFQLAMDAFSEEIPKVMADSIYFISRTLELEFYRKDGTTYWSENKFSLIRDENGSPISIMGEGRNVTDRKRAEEALRESETRYRSVLQSATDAIVTVDGSGIIIGWNNGAERIFGYSYTEAVGLSLTSIISLYHNDGHTNGRNGFQSEGGQNVIGKTVEFKGLRKDKSEFPLELSLSTWETKSEQFFTSIIRDITERKRAEEKLQESQALYHSLVEQLPAGVFRKDYEGRYDFVSTWFCRLKKMRPEEFLG